jgi:hypothetical protein
VHRALFRSPALSARIVGLDQARVEVDQFLAGLGWQVEPDAPGRARFALVLATLRGLSCECDVGCFTPYAQAAERIAAQELDLLPADAGKVDRAAVVARGVLLEVALTSMRLMAEEHEAALRFDGTART